MDEQIPQELKVERLSRLIELQNRITVEINKAHIGETSEVLVEGRSPRDAGRLTGVTGQNKTVNFAVPGGGTRSAESLVGKLVPVRLLEAHLTGFTGEYAEPESNS
jgi:tRNA-2-methylthio-N6-dimethylallyladenosine synthase